MKSVVVALLIAAWAPVGEAQKLKPIANWDNLNQLMKGAEIQVTLVTGRSLRGFLQQVTNDSLAINATTSQEMLPRPEIRRVALKRESHRGRNTLIGLGVGIGAGLATGAGIDAQTNHGDWFPSAGKAVFAPVGAIIGTVVGVAMPTGGWRDVYRAPVP
jgi:hypothetical protein